MFVLSILIFTLLLITVALIDYQSWLMFIDGPSLLSVTALSALFTFIAIPPKQVMTAVKGLLSRESEMCREKYQLIQQFFSLFGSAALLIGLFLTVVFWISLAEQAHQILAPGASLSLSFSLFFSAYGLLIKILCYLISQRMHFRLRHADDLSCK